MNPKSKTPLPKTSLGKNLSDKKKTLISTLCGSKNAVLQVKTFMMELNSLSFPGLVILVQYPPCLVQYTFWSRLMNITKMRRQH